MVTPERVLPLHMNCTRAGVGTVGPEETSNLDLIVHVSGGEGEREEEEEEEGREGRERGRGREREREGGREGGRKRGGGIKREISTYLINTL